MSISRQAKAAGTARAVRTARAAKRAADLAPIVAELQANGARSQRALAAELNRRGIPTASGRGEWKADTRPTSLNTMPAAEPASSRANLALRAPGVTSTQDGRAKIGLRRTERSARSADGSIKTKRSAR
jgi:hypothetical protein